MQEFKKRLISFLWTIPYFLVALFVDFLTNNLGLLDLTPMELVFITAALREVGKAARNQIK